jgi:catechol 2,3-dioxygenase-like lactoylglutathione lyase family enzyme
VRLWLRQAALRAQTNHHSPSPTEGGRSTRLNPSNLSVIDNEVLGTFNFPERHSMQPRILSSPRIICVFAVISAALASAFAQSPPASAPALINTCLITSNVDRLVAFYEPVLRLKAIRSGPDYAEFHTAGGVLAIFSAKAQQAYIPNSAEPASNRSLVLEYRVANVDGEYARLQKLIHSWVKPPTTQPWGTRSFYFRDPDGNLVDFFERPIRP